MGAVVEALGGWGGALSVAGWVVILSAFWAAALFVRWLWRYLVSPYDYVKVQSRSGGSGCLVGLAVVVGVALLLGLGGGR